MSRAAGPLPAPGAEPPDRNAAEAWHALSTEQVSARLRTDAARGRKCLAWLILGSVPLLVLELRKVLLRRGAAAGCPRRDRARLSASGR